MTLQQLRYLVAIADTNSFAEAASECHVTQPTLSAMIKKLEDELGADFFDRNRKPFGLTPLGMEVVRRARKVLAEAEAIPAFIKETQTSLSGEIRLGILPTIAPYLLPLFLAAFAKTYPDITLVIQELKTDQINARIHEGRLDLGILATPHKAIEGLSIKPLFKEEFYAYAKTPPSKKYLLAEDINPDELWVLEEGHCFGDQVLDLCALSRSSHTLHYVSGSIDTLKRLVESQGGITVLPKLATYSLNHEELLHCRQFAPPVPTREISLVCAPNFVRLRAAEALENSILKHLPADILRE